MTVSLSALTILALGLSLGVSATASASPTFSTIYGFAGGGANPLNPPILGADGALYGTTANGGAQYSGAIYRVVLPSGGAALGSGSVIYSFAGGTDGQSPYGSLVKGSAGQFYGTTFGGGANGFGTIFELAPPTAAGASWTKTTLYNFTSGTDGAYPRAGLVACGAGFCGTTSGVYGMAGAYGTVFQLLKPTKKNPQWRLTTLYAFQGGSDGGAPDAALTRCGSGILYGTATGNLGGTGNTFSLTPPAKAGAAWTHSVLHDFPFGADGFTPIGGVVCDGAGALYGTTASGGANQGGTVYRLTPPAPGATQWTEDILASLPAGATPQGTPAFGPTGLLYFTTLSGGAANMGSIAALKRSAAGAPPWTLTTVHDFAGGADGGAPEGAFTKGPAGALFGTSSGNDAVGTIFELTK